MFSDDFYYQNIRVVIKPYLKSIKKSKKIEKCVHSVHDKVSGWMYHWFTKNSKKIPLFQLEFSFESILTLSREGVDSTP